MKHIKFSYTFMLAFFLLIILLLLPTKAVAQTENPWSMAGANPERTSWSPEEVSGQLRPQWYVPIEPYIPSKVPIIAANGLLYVSTAKGLYALDAANGSHRFTYATHMPLGHAPTIVGNVGYVGGLDHKMHAFNATTGTALWTYEASSGFDTNPLVVNDTVYLGNRDGFLYAIWADTSTQKGKLRWRFQTQGAILFSAAFHQPTNTLYFASQDSYAYAVNATSGQQVWKSVKLPGYGFHSWWPVVYTDPQTQKVWVIFSGANGMRNTRPGIVDFSQLTTEETFYFFDPANQNLPNLTPIGPTAVESGSWSPGSGKWISGTTYIDTSRPNVVSAGSTKAITEYFEAKPTRRTYFVLDALNGNELTTDFDHDGKPEYAPILWHGTQSGNRYPPVVGIDRTLYQGNMLGADRTIGRSQISGYKLGTPFVSLPSGWQAVDEPQAFAGGGNLIYWNLCCDRMAASFNIGTSSGSMFFSYNLRTLLGGTNPYYQQYYQDPHEAHVWDTYGAGGTGGSYGSHGNQNPPIPYRGKVYMHRSNAVIAWGPQSVNVNKLSKLASPQTSSPTITLPSKDSLKVRLESEVQKIISAGHLRPGFYVDGIPGQVIHRQRECMLNDYFHAPFDTHYTLLRALPHLNSTLQNQLRTYLQNEASQYPLTLTTIGWAGASREAFRLWDEIEADMKNHGPSPWGECLGNNGGWGQNPFKHYAMWKYAVAFGNATTHYNSAKSVLEMPVSDSLLTEHPHWLNAYLAGYYGFLELEKLANQPENTTVKNHYNRLLNLRISSFNQAVPNEYLGNSEITLQYNRQLTAARNFMFLVPEVASALRPSLTTKVADAVSYYNRITPYWFVTSFDANIGEGVLQNLYDPHAIFQAKALLLREPYEELVKYLDVPAFERGDLFYIDNLVVALDAPYSGPNSPTPVVTPGDANGDSRVDGVDYTIWLNHYNQSGGGFVSGDFNNSGRVDGDDYIIWLNNYFL